MHFQYVGSSNDDDDDDKRMMMRYTRRQQAYTSHAFFFAFDIHVPRNDQDSLV